MSDDQLDDEAPPDIPDISSDPEVGPIPALPSQIPPSMPVPLAAAEARARSDSDLDVDVDIDVDVPSEPGEEIEPEAVPALPPPRKRMQTNPATPIARQSMPPPAADADAGEALSDSLKPPRAPSIPMTGDLEETTTRMDEAELEKTIPRAPDLEKTLPRPPDFAPDLDEPTTRMADAAGEVRPMLPLEISEGPPTRPASVPPRPQSQPPRPVSQPPRPVSQPPRPMSQPPRAAPAASVPQATPPAPPKRDSQPPRPVSQPNIHAVVPPKRDSQPPRAGAQPGAPAAGAKHDSEPPTQPWHAPPEPPDADHAATSYPPPPMVHEEEHEPPPPPSVSVKPMRVIGVKHSPAPGEKTEPSPPRPPAAAPAAPAAPTPRAEELSDDDFAPASSESVDDGEISFPADEKEDKGEEPAKGDELTEDDIAAAPERDSAPEIPVEVEEPKAAAPAPPPPPRREAQKPPSVADAKEAQRSKQRKAWWEELFGEDFARANAKLKTPQIVHEADFIEESLGVAKGGVLLDLACGGGQHAVELAQRGYGVVGYDLSLYQLAVAADVAQEAGQKLNLLQGDMREMAFEEMFDGIYCWNTSFGYFEEEKNQAVAQRIFRALRPGGMFLLDVANRDYVVANQPAQTWFEGDACVCMDDMAVDFITSRLKVKRSLILDDGRTMECSYSIRLYSLHELGKILHDAGFRVTEASGHPATPGVFFGASSPRILILAQRP